MSDPEFGGQRLGSGGQSPEQREINHLKMKLIAADKVMLQLDDLIHRNKLNARSKVADARLDYGTPFEYEYNK